MIKFLAPEITEFNSLLNFFEESVIFLFWLFVKLLSLIWVFSIELFKFNDFLPNKFLLISILDDFFLLKFFN